MTNAQVYNPETSVDVQRRLSEFFGKLSRAQERALLLDYDGTLARFCVDADRATPYLEVPPLLDRIRKHTGTRLVIVTGRRACDAARLLGIDRVEVWGCHGLERLHPNGKYEMPGVDDRLVKTIAEADRLLTVEGLADLLEHKPAGIAIHWRGREAVSDEVRNKVQSVWESLRNKVGLRLEPFDGGLEIRVVTANKGDVVRTMLSELGPDPAVAYLGDDRTDEDAFVAIEGHGLSVLVRSEFRATAAEVWIRPPEGLVAFLTDWNAACGGAS
jgi:trehalose 6-phosphate phosphatase